MGKQGILIALLAILLLVAASYIGYMQYNSYKQNKQLTAYAIYQNGTQAGAEYGYQYGYTQAVAAVFQEAVKCQPFNVTYSNQTINLIAIECPEMQALLKQSQQIQQMQQQYQQEQQTTPQTPGVN